MVRAPEYEEMDRARSEAVPRAFREVFGSDSGLDLKEFLPKQDPRVAGPIERSTYHIYRGKERVAEIYQNGHMECFDDSIKDKLQAISMILEEEAGKAYRRVKNGEYY